VLVAPLFVRAGTDLKEPIASLEGHFHFSPDTVVDEAQALAELGVGAICLFGIPETKDAEASGAWDDQGVVQQAIRNIKAFFKRDQESGTTDPKALAS